MVESEIVTVIAMIVILSFAIDRIVSGALFLLSFSAGWSRKFPEPALMEAGRKRFEAEKKQKLIYSLLAGFLGIVVLAGFANVRVLAALGIKPPESSTTSNNNSNANTNTNSNATSNTNSNTGTQLQTTSEPPKPPFSYVLLDILITGLILTGGADRMSQLMKLTGGGAHVPGADTPEPKPLQITGKLTLEEGAGKRSATDEAEQRETLD